MTSLRRAGLVGATLAAALVLALRTGSGAGAQPVDAAAAPRALASNGAAVIMPEIETLDCDGMSQVLHRIDLSNYRAAEPVPEGHPDWAIFEYEDRLTITRYWQCHLGEAQLKDPGPAFASGFAPSTE